MLPSAIHLHLAVAALRSGNVIAYPTEAVWGFGCDPWQPAAVQKLWDIKRRDPGKGLILIAGDWSQLASWLDPLPLADQRVLRETWPGPVTWLVPVPKDFPTWLRGRHDQVALRVSAHPGVRALCAAFGGPLVSTSANRAGQPPATELSALRRRFGGELAHVLPGALGGLGRPTEIRDLVTRRVIRAG